MLVHAQNVNISFDSYFSIIGFVMIEIFALLHDEALMRWPHGDDGHLLIDHVI